ncbi:MAG: ABC transporter substrate-binding protein [Burkholderiales bacterium]
MSLVPRRTFLAASGGLVVTAMAARAQPRARLHRIGYLQTATPDEQAPLTKAFDDGLRDLGYVEGRNLVIERRFAWGHQDRLPGLAAELVRLDVDVIVTGANIVIAAVLQATSTVPVVMATSRDPVGSGFVASLAHPGGNVTGLTGDPTPEVQAKRLELLKATVPRASRVAVLLNPTAPAADTYQAATGSAASKLGITLVVVPARGRDEFEAAFAKMAGERVEALVVLPDPVFFTARAGIVELARRYRLPAVYHAKEVVEAGGLMSYGASLADQFRRAASYVDRILKGAKPGDLPVEQAAKFEFAVNMTTARTLGVVVPRDLLLRADLVIE